MWRRVKDVLPKNVVLKILIGIIFLYMLSGILVGQYFLYYDIGSKLDLRRTIYVQYIISILVTLILSFATVSSSLFHADDFFVLAALPMKPKQILYAKSISLLLAIEFVQFLVVIPSVITFACLSEVKVIGIFLIQVILITAVIFCIMCIISSLFALGRSNKGMYRVSIIFIGILFLYGAVWKIVSGYSCIMNAIDMKDTKQKLSMRILKNCYNKSVVLKSICKNSVGFSNVMISVLILCLTVAILFLILSKLFARCVITYDYSEVRFKNYTFRLTKISNKMLLLMRREFWVVQSEPFFKINLIMEYCLAPLILTILSIILCFARKSKEVQDFLELANGKWYLPYIIMGIILLIISTQASFLVPVSKEGKFYILSRTLPISYELQYKAKSLYIFIMSGISTSIAYWIVTAMQVFVYDHVVLNYIILLEVLFLLAFVSSASDYKRPYIDWDEPRKATNGNLMLLFGMLHDFAIFAILAVIIIGGAILFKNELLQKLSLALIILIMDIVSEKWNISRINKRYRNVQI